MASNEAPPADAQADVPAATRLTGVTVGSNADGVTVTLRGNGRLAYSAIQEADRPPARLVIDFQGVRPDVAASTPGQGVVRRVRVALNNAEPVVTRVVLDLERLVSHRLRPSADGREVVVTLESGAPSETTASAAPSAAPAPVEAAAPGERVATRLSSIVLGQAPEGVTITLKGNGRLVPRPIEQAKDAPPRLVLDLPGVRPGVAATTRVNQGVVDRVRVAMSSKSPAVTRVVLQMKKQFLYRMRVGQTDPSEVTITIADPVTQTEPSAEFVLADPVGAGAKPAATPARASSTPAPSVASSEPMEPVRPTTTGTGDRNFSGRPVSLDFQGVDLRAVLRTFSEITGLNVVIDPGVKGTVDVSLREVPWDQALDIILRANQLGYSIEGTIVRIAPLDILAKEEQSRRMLKEEQDLSGELKTVTKALSYAKATDLRALLLKSALTKRGTIELDDRTNTLIVKDLQVGLDQANALIVTLDTPQPQVEIEARIIETQAAFAKELGLRLGFEGSISPALGNTLPLTFPNSGRPRRQDGHGRHAGAVADSDRDEGRQRRLLDQRGAVGAGDRGQGQGHLGAARHHAEQRRRRNSAGRADSLHHRHEHAERGRHRDDLPGAAGAVQGRGAEADGEAAHHRVGHRDHGSVAGAFGRELRAVAAWQPESGHRHAEGPHDRAGHRRRDGAHRRRDVRDQSRQRRSDAWALQAADHRQDFQPHAQGE